MALVYNCGFDLLGNFSDLTMEGWNNNGGGGGGLIQVSTSAGRGGGGCMQVERGNGGGNNPMGAIRQFTNQGLAGAHSFVGFAYSAPTGTGNQVIGFLDSGTFQIWLFHAGDGSMLISRNGTTLGTLGAGTFTYNTFHYIELDFVIDPSVGSVLFKMDGVTLLNLTNQNTRASANSQWNQIVCGGNAGQSIVNLFSYDDLYYCDPTTASLNSLLGDTRVIGNLPTGAGTYAQMTKVGAASTHWQSVNEKPTDGDTTYVSSSVVNTVDTYTYPVLPANTQTVLAVTGRPNARKDDAGFRSLETHLRSTASGMEADSPTASILGTSYQYYEEIFPINPITGLAWTVSDVNNMEYGPKVAA
jgi:hypothetical protein